MILQEKVDDAKMYLFQIPATIPYGGVGKMLVYKSGVVKLKMGDFLFLVSILLPSPPHMFLHLHIIHPSICIRVWLLLFFDTCWVYYNMQVSTGIDSSFHQEIMPVNTNEKQCCSLGKPNNTWAVVTPDIE